MPPQRTEDIVSANCKTFSRVFLSTLHRNFTLKFVFSPIYDSDLCLFDIWCTLMSTMLTLSLHSVAQKGVWVIPGLEMSKGLYQHIGGDQVEGSRSHPITSADHGSPGYYSSRPPSSYERDSKTGPEPGCQSYDVEYAHVHCPEKWALGTMSHVLYKRGQQPVGEAHLRSERILVKTEALLFNVGRCILAIYISL